MIGSTGYLGSRLIPKLIERGHAVTAVVRSGSRARELTGCRIVHADPLDAASLTPHMQVGDTVVQLVGVPKPAPWKGAQFRAVDLTAGLASIEATGTGLVVVAESGARLDADIVVLAIGVKPENGLARAAGLEIGAKGGIVVDPAMRTSDPSIWAVGDVVEVSPPFDPSGVTSHAGVTMMFEILCPMAEDVARRRT